MTSHDKRWGTIDSSLHLDDLDQSSHSFHPGEILGGSQTPRKNDSNQNFHRSKLLNSKFQQSCFEFGDSDLTIVPGGRARPAPPALRRTLSSDNVELAALSTSSCIGIQPPRRSKSSENEIETMAAVASASRRGRRPAPRAKSAGQNDAAILEKIVINPKPEAPANKLSALQRQSVKRDGGPKKESRRLGLAPPGTGDGIFKAKIKVTDGQIGSNGKRVERKKSGGLVGLLKGRPTASVSSASSVS